MIIRNFLLIMLRRDVLRRLERLLHLLGKFIRPHELHLTRPLPRANVKVWTFKWRAELCDARFSLAELGLPLQRSALRDPSSPRMSLRDERGTEIDDAKRIGSIA